MKLTWKTILFGIVGILVLWVLFFTTKTNTKYTTETVQSGALMQTVDITSSWYPVGYANITLGTSQDIRKIYVKEGDHVKSGQVLVQMNDDQEYNQYKVAQAAYYAAIKAKKDASALPLTPKSTLDSMQGQINSAYYQVKNAEVALNKKKIKATITGKVLSISTSDYDTSGATASALSAASATTSSGNSIILVDDKHATFSVLLSEQDVNQVKKGQAVTVTSRLRANGYNGVVSKVVGAPAVAGEQPSYSVDITLSTYPDIPYGAKIDGSIITAKKQDALYLPYDAVTIETVSTGSVLVLENGQEVKREVTIGITTDTSIEIVSGLSSTDQVIVDKLPATKVITLRPWIRNLFTR